MCNTFDDMQNVTLMLSNIFKKSTTLIKHVKPHIFKIFSSDSFHLKSKKCSQTSILLSKLI
jgi:hypothetical protein